MYLKRLKAVGLHLKSGLKVHWIGFVPEDQAVMVHVCAHKVISSALIYVKPLGVFAVWRKAGNSDKRCTRIYTWGEATRPEVGSLNWLNHGHTPPSPTMSCRERVGLERSRSGPFLPTESWNEAFGCAPPRLGNPRPRPSP